MYLIYFNRKMTTTSEQLSRPAPDNISATKVDAKTRTDRQILTKSCPPQQQPATLAAWWPHNEHHTTPTLHIPHNPAPQPNHERHHAQRLNTPHAEASAPTRRVNLTSKTHNNVDKTAKLQGKKTDENETLMAQKTIGQHGHDDAHNAKRTRQPNDTPPREKQETQRIYTTRWAQAIGQATRPNRSTSLTTSRWPRAIGLKETTQPKYQHTYPGTDAKHKRRILRSPARHTTQHPTKQPNTPTMTHQEQHDMIHPNRMPHARSTHTT